jgi:hypothetical protein
LVFINYDLNLMTLSVRLANNQTKSVSKKGQKLKPTIICCSTEFILLKSFFLLLLVFIKFLLYFEPQLFKLTDNLMKFFKREKLQTGIFLFFSMIFLSSCLTSKKMDAYISDQYNNEIPKVNKRKQVADIIYSPAFPSTTDNISTTAPHTKVLPLVLYWVIDSRHTSTLNSGIAATDFSNSVNTMAHKGLMQKLAGRKLQLTVEQAPASFSLVDKTHAIFLVIYAIHWDKVYIEPEVKDLVVSYKLEESDKTIKTGKITIRDMENNKSLRFFQSWKSAVSEQLTNYDSNVTAMTNQFVDKLMQEL